MRVRKAEGDERRAAVQPAVRTVRRVAQQVDDVVGLLLVSANRGHAEHKKDLSSRSSLPRKMRLGATYLLNERNFEIEFKAALLCRYGCLIFF